MKSWLLRNGQTVAFLKFLIGVEFYWNCDLGDTNGSKRDFAQKCLQELPELPTALGCGVSNMEPYIYTIEWLEVKNGFERSQDSMGTFK